MSSFDTNTYNQPQRSDRNKYTIYIIGFLVIVIIGLIVFGKSNNDTKDLEDEIEELMTEKEKHDKKVDSLENSLIYYKEVTIEFKRKDSLNSIEMDRQKEKTAWLIRQQRIAQQERKKVEKELEDFKKNPPKHDLNKPYSLLIDTERRINEDKNKDNYDDNNDG